LQVPPVIPDTIQQIADETTMPTTAAPELPGVPWGLEARSTDSVLTGLLAGLPAHSPPLPPSSLPRTGRPGRLRISHVDPAKLIFQPKPNYPPLALATRVQGTVRLEAIINRNGQIGELRVLSGHPLLVRAALDAVSRWRYQPTLLNGEPVEVVTEIEVRFSLGE
jgi:protein TonB